ncbi:MAG: GDP-mannose 4,6-dehydratase [Chloroflexota bacterium]
MRALITGVLGQDGSYLAEHLVEAGHEVFGLTRRANATSPATLLVGDLLDQPSLERALRASRPDVVYNLAAVTAPGAGWGSPQPPLLADVTGVGVIRLLEAMTKASPNARLVHASSSAVIEPHRYGLYGAAKLFAHQAVQGYRGRIDASNAVLYSHSSPRQDGRFLLPRICATIRRFKADRLPLVLGDIHSRRDWGYAPAYMRAVQEMADEKAGDRVIATGRQHSVCTVTETALRLAGLDWDDVVRVDPNAPRVEDEQLATVDRPVDVDLEAMIGEMLEVRP